MALPAAPQVLYFQHEICKLLKTGGTLWRWGPIAESNRFQNAPQML
jgi:hypothetical protein